MFGRITPERTFASFTIMDRIAACLPPSPAAGNLQIILYKFYSWLCLLLSLAINIPIMYDLYLNIDDADFTFLNTAELCPLCVGTVRMAVCKIYATKIQVLKNRRKHTIFQYNIIKCRFTNNKTNSMFFECVNRNVFRKLKAR